MNVTFEVLDSLNSELQSGILIAHKDGVWVLLKGRHRPHVVNPLLDGLVQGKGFVCSSDENHDLRGRWISRGTVRSLTVPQRCGLKSGFLYINV